MDIGGTYGYGIQVKYPYQFFDAGRVCLDWPWWVATNDQKLRPDDFAAVRSRIVGARDLDLDPSVFVR